MNNPLYFAKRAALGILVMLSVGIVLEILPSPAFGLLDTNRFLLLDPLREAWMAFWAALAAFAGAYVARVHFTAVAVLFNTISFVVIVQILYSISVQAGAAEYTEIVGRNSAGFLISTLAVIAGAEFGRWLSKRAQRASSHAV